MNLFVSYLGLGVGLSLAALLFGLALRLARADRLERKKSAARVSSLWGAIRGRAHTRDDYLPDARVRGGLVYNKRVKRLEISGRLTEDTLDRIFR